MFSSILTALIINNVVLSQFLGICPFLGVSTNLKTASGMGIMVIFVTTAAAIITWCLQIFVLARLDLLYLQTIVFILVIASLVQLLEMILQKYIPSLYNAFGIFLPLITTNCVVLGVCISVADKNYSFGQMLTYSLATTGGFLLAIVLMAGIRERLEDSDVPKFLQGFPIALISAGLMALAFMGLR